MRDAAFATVFGADAIRAVAISAREGRDASGRCHLCRERVWYGSGACSSTDARILGLLEGLKSNADTTAASLGEVSTVIAGPLVVAATAAAQSINLLLQPLIQLIDLAKALPGALGANSFNPATASAADFLVRVQDLRAAYGDLLKVSGPPQRIFVETTQEAIRALRQQRDELAASGRDTTVFNATIQLLQEQLRQVAGTDVGGKLGGNLQKIVGPLKDALATLEQIRDIRLAEGLETEGVEADIRSSRSRSRTTSVRPS